ncbi:Vegetative incompatibility protein HET-E-1 [Diplonema papillatum]|nr:Vegetative incompatibility protein HET-E-1 [Diplonema papillatum]
MESLLQVFLSDEPELDTRTEYAGQAAWLSSQKKAQQQSLSRIAEECQAVTAPDILKLLPTSEIVRLKRRFDGLSESEPSTPLGRSSLSSASSAKAAPVCKEPEKADSAGVGDEGRVTRDVFVRIMLEALHTIRPVGQQLTGELTGGLEELFRAIDFDGSGGVSWEEFTHYLIHSYAALNQAAHRFLPYRVSSVQTKSREPSAGCKTVFLPSLSKLMTIDTERGEAGAKTADGDSSVVRIFDPSSMKTDLGAVIEQQGAVASHCFLPGANQLMLGIEGGFVNFFQYKAEPKPWSHGSEGVEASWGSRAAREHAEKLRREKLVFAKQQFRLLGSHRFDRTSLALHCDEMEIGRPKLFSGNRDGEVLVFDISASPSDRPPLIAHLRDHQEPISCISTIPDVSYARRVVAASYFGKVTVTDLQKNASVELRGASDSKRHRQGVYSIDYCRDNNLLITAGYEPEPILWLPTHGSNQFVGRLVDNQDPHKCSLLGAKLVPNSQQVMTCDRSGMFKLWDLRKSACMRTWHLQRGLTRLQTLAFEVTNFAMDPSPYTHSVYCTAKTDTHMTMLYKLVPLQLPKVNTAVSHDAKVSHVLYNAETKTFLTAAGTELKVWDARTGVVSLEFHDVSTSDVTAICLDDKGRRFVLGTHEGGVAVHSFATGALIEHKLSHRGEVSSVVYLAAHRLMAAASHDWSVFVYQDREDAEQPRFVLRGQAAFTSLAYSAQLHLLIAGDTREKFYVYDVNNPLACNLLRKCHRPAGQPPAADASSVDEYMAPLRSEVTTMAILAPLAAAVVANACGQLFLWATRPDPLAYELLTSWGTPKNEARRTPVTNVATTAAWSFESELSFVCGDDRGQVSVWDMREVAVFYELEPTRYPSRDAAPVLSFRKKRAAKRKPRLRCSWPATPGTAHPIVGLVLIGGTQLAVAGDNVVSLWSLDGTRLGSLRQGADAEPRGFSLNLGPAGGGDAAVDDAFEVPALPIEREAKSKHRDSLALSRWSLIRDQVLPPCLATRLGAALTPLLRAAPADQQAEPDTPRSPSFPPVPPASPDLKCHKPTHVTGIRSAGVAGGVRVLAGDLRGPGDPAGGCSTYPARGQSPASPRRADATLPTTSRSRAAPQAVDAQKKGAAGGASGKKGAAPLCEGGGGEDPGDLTTVVFWRPASAGEPAPPGPRWVKTQGRGTLLSRRAERQNQRHAAELARVRDTAHAALTAAVAKVWRLHWEAVCEKMNIDEGFRVSHKIRRASTAIRLGAPTFSGRAGLAFAGGRRETKDMVPVEHAAKPLGSPAIGGSKQRRVSSGAGGERRVSHLTAEQQSSPTKPRRANFIDGDTALLRSDSRGPFSSDSPAADPQGSPTKPRSANHDRDTANLRSDSRGSFLGDAGAQVTPVKAPAAEPQGSPTKPRRAGFAVDDANHDRNTANQQSDGRVSLSGGGCAERAGDAGGQLTLGKAPAAEPQDSPTKPQRASFVDDATAHPQSDRRGNPSAGGCAERAGDPAVKAPAAEPQGSPTKPRRASFVDDANHDPGTAHLRSDSRDLLSGGCAECPGDAGVQLSRPALKALAAESQLTRPATTTLTAEQQPSPRRPASSTAGCLRSDSQGSMFAGGWADRPEDAEVQLSRPALKTLAAPKTQGVVRVPAAAPKPVTTPWMLAAVKSTLAAGLQTVPAAGKLFGAVAGFGEADPAARPSFASAPPSPLSPGRRARMGAGWFSRAGALEESRRDADADVEDFDLTGIFKMAREQADNDMQRRVADKKVALLCEGKSPAAELPGFGGEEEELSFAELLRACPSYPFGESPYLCPGAPAPAIHPLLFAVGERGALRAGSPRRASLSDAGERTRRVFAAYTAVAGGLVAVSAGIPNPAAVATFDNFLFYEYAHGLQLALSGVFGRRWLGCVSDILFDNFEKCMLVRFPVSDPESLPAWPVPVTDFSVQRRAALNDLVARCRKYNVPHEQLQLALVEDRVHRFAETAADKRSQVEVTLDIPDDACPSIAMDRTLSRLRSNTAFKPGNTCTPSPPPCSPSARRADAAAACPSVAVVGEEDIAVATVQLANCTLLAANGCDAADPELDDLTAEPAPRASRGKPQGKAPRGSRAPPRPEPSKAPVPGCMRGRATRPAAKRGGGGGARRPVTAVGGLSLLPRPSAGPHRTTLLVDEVLLLPAARRGDLPTHPSPGGGVEDARAGRQQRSTRSTPIAGLLCRAEQKGQTTGLASPKRYNAGSPRVGAEGGMHGGKAESGPTGLASPKSDNVDDTSGQGGDGKVPSSKAEGRPTDHPPRRTNGLASARGGEGKLTGSTRPAAQAASAAGAPAARVALRFSAGRSLAAAFNDTSDAFAVAASGSPPPPARPATAGPPSGRGQLTRGGRAAACDLPTRARATSARRPLSGKPPTVGPSPTASPARQVPSAKPKASGVGGVADDEATTDIDSMPSWGAAAQSRHAEHCLSSTLPDLRNQGAVGDVDEYDDRDDDDDDDDEVRAAAGVLRLSAERHGNRRRTAEVTGRSGTPGAARFRKRAASAAAKPPGAKPTGNGSHTLPRPLSAAGPGSAGQIGVLHSVRDYPATTTSMTSQQVATGFVTAADNLYVGLVMSRTTVVKQVSKRVIKAAGTVKKLPPDVVTMLASMPANDGGPELDLHDEGEQRTHANEAFSSS